MIQNHRIIKAGRARRRSEWNGIKNVKRVKSEMENRIKVFGVRRKERVESL